jgi:3-phenylpropionate/cinnamic acid dioxygenase small subunit
MADTSLFVHEHEEAAVNGPSVSDTADNLRKLVYLEATLLDQRRLEEWLDLYTDDAIYWVPATPDQASPTDHVSLFYDDKQTMVARIRRLRHPEIHAQIPAARTCRLVTGIDVELMAGSSEADASATSNHFIVEYRRGREQRIFAGHCCHRFVRRKDKWMIVYKRLDLINCDASFAALTVPL